MCGQCGVLATTLITSEMKCFLNNLRMNFFRGRDSTGVVAYSKLVVTKEGKKNRIKAPVAQAWKEPRDVFTFLSYNDLDKKGVKEKMFDPAGKRLMMGHCRAATVGEVSTKNAHPFQAGDILGMHNGTIKKAFKGSEKFSTDSEAFFNLISEIGIKDAIQEVEGFTTAYAIQYLDLQKNTFHVVRNSDRPLHFIYTSGRGALFWSSDPEDLRYAALKSGVLLEKESYQPKPYQLMTFNLLQDSPHMKFEEEDLTPKKASSSVPATTPWAPPIAGRGGRTDRYCYHGPDKRWNLDTQKMEICVGNVWRTESLADKVRDAHKKARENTLNTTEDIPIGKSETKQYTANPKEQVVFYGFHGKSYMRPDFERLLLNGCANCQYQPDINEEDIEFKIGWNDPTTFFCEDCSEIEEVGKFLVKYRLKAQDVSDEIGAETQDVDVTEDT